MLSTVIAYTYTTREGTFTIRRLGDGRWQPMFDNELIFGPLPFAQQVAEELGAGAFDWPFASRQPTLPADLEDWTPHSR